ELMGLGAEPHVLYNLLYEQRTVARVRLAGRVLGLFLPDRSRKLAVVGTITSLALFLGIFGVLIAAVLLNPDEKTNSGTQSLFSGVGTFFVELR
ncbi:MAG: hypothetical protein GY826_35030, partial [Fuerstiella sp.]|nr:hypothetical protein [Fuerstiella sp.]